MRDNSYTHLEADMDLQSKIMKKLCPLLPLLLLVLLQTSSISASTFTVSNCSSSLYNSSSSNLQTIREVSSSLTNASASQLFYNISSTSSSSTTYGMYQCRGDVSADFCYNCVIDSLDAAMQQSCQNYTGAHVSKEHCHVRYDSQPGLFDGTSPDMSPKLYIWKQMNDLNETFLNDVLEASLEAVRLAPTQPGLVAYTKKGSIYALAQCDFYLSESQCSTCLDLTLKAAIHTNESDQGIVYFGSCFYRYEAFSFYFAQPVSPSSSAGAIAGGVVGSILFLGLIAYLLWFYYGRKKKSQVRLYDDLNPFHPSAIIYSYDELRAATQNFHPDNKLGEGGFGPVYKGILADGQEVAIKKLSIGSHQGKQEFTNEVTMITSVQHRNLIRLLGCCIEGPERLLVYEYLPKKSLDMYIFGSEDENHTNIMLDWKTRVEIIQGVARGLAYLHEESQIHIIHRDIKPGNILLDNNLTPKIADFGLARLSNNADENHVTKTISGTIGYLSPEYAMHGQLTEKADVFSFGVVILEIVSGRRSIDYTQPQEKQRLLEWAWKCYREGEQLQLLDPRLKNIAKEEEEEFTRVIHVAVLCTQSLATDRPSMSKVGQLLVGKIEDLHVTNNNLFSNTTSLDHLRTIMDTTSTVPLIQQPFYTTGSASSQNFKVIPR